VPAVQDVAVRSVGVKDILREMCDQRVRACRQLPGRTLWQESWTPARGLHAANEGLVGRVTFHEDEEIRAVGEARFREKDPNLGLLRRGIALEGGVGSSRWLGSLGTSLQPHDLLTHS
jgi:hypothetical protein